MAADDYIRGAATQLNQNSKKYNMQTNPELNGTETNTSEQVVGVKKIKQKTAALKTPKSKSSKAVKKSAPKKAVPYKKGKGNSGNSPYPRHTIEKALRIPKAILNQNAGKECSEDEAARFVGLKKSNGEFR